MGRNKALAAMTLPLSGDDGSGQFRFTSSVPWVLVGARRGPSNDRHDTVIASGGNAGTELVGFVREQEFSGVDEAHGRVSAFALRGSRFGAVTSEDVSPSLLARDQRSSAYTFAWQGETKYDGYLDEQFRRSLPDILDALDRGSKDDLEWAIARLVFIVDADTMSRRRKRRNLVSVAAIEIVLMLVVAVVLILVLR
jgi:hypothetical protein